MSLSYLITSLGLLPAHSYSLYFPLIVIVLWIVFLPLAHLKKISVFYNASLRAAFGEELIFRGLIYGAALLIWRNELFAIVISSVLFGVVHMRNVWWAGWRRSWRTTTYAGFKAGPIFALIRWLSGDIYLGILVHYLHNTLVMFPPPGLKHRMAVTPTNRGLRAKSLSRGGR